MQFLIKRIYLLFPLWSWTQVNLVNFYLSHQLRKQKKDTLSIFLHFFVSVRRQETLQCDIWPSEFIQFYSFPLWSWIQVNFYLNHQPRKQKKDTLSTFLHVSSFLFVAKDNAIFLTKRIYSILSLLSSLILDPTKFDKFLSKSST